MISRFFRYFETLVDPYTAYPDTDTPPRRLFAFLWDYSQPFKKVYAATMVMSLVVAAIFFLALTAVSSSVFRSTALDLTEENIYTLSEGTERAIANIDEPITFRLFVSSSLTENFPQYAIYADRVRQMLERNDWRG